jgi:signal transduction histidine kinase
LDTAALSLEQMLGQLVAQVRRNFSIACRMRVVGAKTELPREVASEIYKIAQESVSNAVKHGRATLVLISVIQREDSLTLRIKNDGVPFPEKLEPNQRMGLRIMNYRARTLDGSFEIRANGQNGTIVTCVIPILNSRKVIQTHVVNANLAVGNGKGPHPAPETVLQVAG